MSQPAPNVGLFVTCLADLMRPSVAFGSVKLLEAAGCRVHVPATQTCCGQPAYNSGGSGGLAKLARQVIGTFEAYDYVVAPSGSCAGMLREHYPRLFDAADEWHGRARALGERTWEITSFLVDVLDYAPPAAHPNPTAPANPTAQSAPADPGAADKPATQPDPATPTAAHGQVVTYHDSCAGLREMHIKRQPRRLLREMAGIEVAEMRDTEVCCGFGGTFCARMPDISAKMADDKLGHALATGANLLLGGDLGCLLSLSGRASRTGKAIEVRHVVEVLAGNLDTPAIGDTTNSTNRDEA